MIREKRKKKKTIIALKYKIKKLNDLAESVL